MAKNKFDQESAFKSIIGISQPVEATQKQNHKGRPKSGREIKKRISVVVFPSVYDQIKKIAYIERKSVSDLIGELLSGYVSKNTEKLKEYDKIKLQQNHPINNI